MRNRILLVRDMIRGFSRSDHRFAKAVALARQALATGLGTAGLLRGMVRSPTSALILVTNRCNMRCPDCFFREVIAGPSAARIDLDLGAMTSLFRKPIMRTIGRVTLSGGEPTLCRDLLPIINFLRGRGIVTTLSTNGLLVNEDLLRKLRDADINTINISLYDSDEHGRVRNITVLERIFAAARRMNFDHDRIWLLYHASHISGYREAYRTARDLGARHLFFHRTVVTESDLSDGVFPAPEDAAFAAEYRALCESIDQEGRLRLYRFRPISRGGIVCPQVLMNYVVVWPTGELGPCCAITPKGRYGDPDDPEGFFRFKEEFVSGRIPEVCRSCSMLGTAHG